MRTLVSLAILLASLVLARPILAQEAAHQAERAEQAVLTPGDSVRIVVWRKPEFSGDFVIAPDGSITHPLFRDVKVAGLPFETAERTLRAYLAKCEEIPHVLVEPLIRVAVSGDVTRPQVFAVLP